MNELEAIKEIKAGKKLGEFNSEDVTTLMKLAVIVNHKDGISELTADMWDVASARMAVAQDFRNIKKVPAELMMYCAPELAQWAAKLSKNDFREYSHILNHEIDDDTKQRVIRDNAASRRFLVTNKNIKKAAITNKSRSTSRKGVETPGIDFAELDLSAIDQECGVYTLDAQSFLKADVSEQSAEWLEAIVNADILFPKTFIESLLLPNKKCAAFKKAGDTVSAKYWEDKKIPYLTKELCAEIVKFHPEAAITTPSFLTKDAVREFWDRQKDVLSKSEMTTYFLEFPAEFLDIDMADNVIMSLDILNHAPEVFAGSDIAFKYISRHPRMIFDADERYQLEGLLLSGTVTLNEDNVKKIKNNDLRTKIELALNI